MLASIAWLKRYVDIDVTPEAASSGKGGIENVSFDCMVKTLC